MSIYGTSPIPMPNASPATPTVATPVPAPTPTPQPNVSAVPETFDFVAYTIKQAYWPQVGPATVQDWAAAHRHIAQKLDNAAEKSDRQYGPLSSGPTSFHELLKGKAGDALQVSLAKNVNLWRSDAVEHQNAATALDHAADYLQGLEDDLTAIIDTNGPAYDTAVTHNQFAEANTILAKAHGEAQSAAIHAGERLFSALLNKFGTDPIQYPVPLGTILTSMTNLSTAATATSV